MPSLQTIAPLIVKRKLRMDGNAYRNGLRGKAYKVKQEPGLRYSSPSSTGV
jgi:hypothetical protein